MESTLTVTGAAIRARTVVAGSSEISILGSLEPVGRHAVDGDGSLYFVPQPGTHLAAPLAMPTASPVRITATLYDVAPVPMTDRVRGSVTLTGMLGPHTGPSPAGLLEHFGLARSQQRADGSWPIVMLTPDRVSLMWRCERTHRAVPEAVRIDLDDYRNSGIDPLISCEREWLPHLYADHTDMLEALWATARPGPRPDQVRPLLVDRAGMVLRGIVGGRAHDLRLAFPQPVVCGCEAAEALNAMVSAVVEGPDGPGASDLRPCRGHEPGSDGSDGGHHAGH